MSERTTNINYPFSLSSDFKGAITDILHYCKYSMTDTEEPLLPHANKYIGTQVFIPPRYHYSMYSSNSCNCAEFLTTDKKTRQARPVEQIKHHYILIAPEKMHQVWIFLFVLLLFLRKLSNFARSKPGEQLLIAVLVFGSAGPESV